MKESQIHLALTHVPVILSMVGLVILAVAVLKKNDILTKTAFYLLLFAGLSALPVYFTGEGAEEAIEHLPGVSEGVIEEHEEIAGIAFGMVLAVAIMSLAALLLYRKEQLRRFLQPFILLLAVVTAGVMAYTAHLGGQVRHTEIRAGFAAPTENETVKDQQNRDQESND